MKKFIMIRTNDISGVSGTGRVLDGVQFTNGKVAISWFGNDKVKATSVTIWDNFEDFESVHVTSHPENQTKIIWEDDPEFLKND